MARQNTQRRRFRITGQVQGVGFRPFAYRLARQCRLTGWVGNDPRGVTVEVQGPPAAVHEFARRLRTLLPPLARMDRCDESAAEVIAAEDRFQIRPSTGGQLTDAQVTVDTAVCGDCLREMLDASDPRYRYPFINCTNCGPRYTIVKRVPYDRPNTTMSQFAMCPLCSGQYADPADRRFHAQPIACPRCGPAVWLVDTRGKQMPCEDAIAGAARMLLAGKIVAVKGLGGFHLACRADDAHVVGRLRRRKRRDAKPLAVMVGDLDAAGRLAALTDEAERLLTGPIRPIVLAPAKPACGLAPNVCQGLHTVGLMLPYTPLHHLLFGFGLPPMVMTSGNYSAEPIAAGNDEAIAHLGRIADALLVHNRPIERRIDDSVVQVHYDGRLSVLRRGRGYAPRVIGPAAPGGELAGEPPAILAVGAELKSAVALLSAGRLVLSEHIGDLKDGRTYRHFIDTINHLEQLFEFTPAAIAADAHPEYLSSEYASRRHRGQMPGRAALPIVRVQHHHAHIASCLAENGRGDEVIGLACDGAGYGLDGAVWGCEVLRADLHDYERLGHLRYLPLIGGDAAARQTFRPAVAALHEAFGDSWRLFLPPGRRNEGDQRLEQAVEMLTVGVNCPPTSSLGRWFDAVAWLCGLVEVNSYEGRAPMALEAAVRDGIMDRYEFSLEATGPFVIDLRPAVEGIAADLAARCEVGTVATKFHNTVVAFLAAAAERARRQTGLGVVAFSGGCFANRYLTAGLSEQLARAGFEVLRHERVPCNDGGVALGQAVVAAARMSRRGAAVTELPARE